MAHEENGRNLDPAIRLVLEELRDLRRELRDDHRQTAEDRRRSDERFEHVIAEFRQDSLRRDAVMQKAFETTENAFRDVRSVGLSIVKTLNRHTRILERIDRKLGVRGNGGPGPSNGRTT